VLKCSWSKQCAMKARLGRAHMTKDSGKEFRDLLEG
jgi:hypothetical protein